MKPFNARATGLINTNKIKGFEMVASVASTLNKLNKNKKKGIKVFRFCLATLICLHRSFELIVFKPVLPRFIQCNLATKLTKSQEVSYALT